MEVLIGILFIACLFGLPIWFIASFVDAKRRIRVLEEERSRMWSEIARLKDAMLTGWRAAADAGTEAGKAVREPAGTTPDGRPAVVGGIPVIEAPPVLPSLGSAPGAGQSGAGGTPNVTVPGMAGGDPGRGMGAGAGAPAPAAVVPGPVRPAINWEQFMGVKLFAWMGGLALALGIASFVKYSFDHDLVPPVVRVAVGFLLGLVLLGAGVWLRRREYAVTAHTLLSSGILSLYAATFACRVIYKFPGFGQVPTFLLLAMITSAAFVLAVRLNALVVAVLGMFGGFVTPLVVSEGKDNPLGLFLYVALLDVGLIAVSLRRPWGFLVSLGALGTVVMQAAWVGTYYEVNRYFEGGRVWISLWVFGGFAILFAAAMGWAARAGRAGAWTRWTAAVMPWVVFGFVLFLLSHPVVARRPGVWLAHLLVAEMCLVYLAWRAPGMEWVQLASGAPVFLMLAGWTGAYLEDRLLGWSLGMTLLFSVVHTAVPIVLRKVRPGGPPVWWAHAFPPVALLVIVVPLLKLESISFVVWPVVLAIDLVAIVAGALTASVLPVLAVLLLTLAVTGVWIFRIPMEAMSGWPPVLVVLMFGVFFVVAGVLAARGWIPGLARRGGGFGAGIPGIPVAAEAQIPVMSALLPYVLLILIAARLPVLNPTPLYGAALVLGVAACGVGRWLGIDALPMVALVATGALEWVWHGRHFVPEWAWICLGWSLAFLFLFWSQPFLGTARGIDRVLPWATSALAGPVQFLFVYRLVREAWPNPVMGLLPMAFSVPAWIGLAWVVRKVPPTGPARLGQMAWYGGVVLFFITLVFPIQLDRQWITIGWALEGAALLWLFHRVPHGGLRWVGVGLLVLVFVRLGLNPSVLGYHPRGGLPIFNWYLYTYGLAVAACFAGAAWLKVPDGAWRRAWERVRGLMRGMGVVLAFLLLNIEIADYFTAPGSASLVFEFRGNFARDMTYSLAWALFALVLVTLGLAKDARGARWAGLGLLSVTILKLFFHDLARLSELYRIGALVGVAVIAIVASFLYQRSIAAGRGAGGPK